MPPWLNNHQSYFPIIRFRYGEMLGLKQLPLRDKSRLSPLIPIAPAPNAHRAAPTFERIRESMGGQGLPFIADLVDEAGSYHQPHEVHILLNSLASPDRHFSAWKSFIRDNGDMIPVIRSPHGVLRTSIDSQISDFEQLGRGVVVRLRQQQPDAAAIGRRAVNSVENLANLLVVIDLGQINEILAPLMGALALIENLTAEREDETLYVSCVGTSFPFSFQGDARSIVQLPIIERQLVESLETQPALADKNVRIFFGDYGSGRAEDRDGWKGPPRVDYATRSAWLYNRRQNEEQAAGITAAAHAIVNHEMWDNELQLWGAQKITDAANGDISELGATWALPAVRINMHLHAQIHFNSPREDFLATDEEWID